MRENIMKIALLFLLRDVKLISSNQAHIMRAYKRNVPYGSINVGMSVPLAIANEAMLARPIMYP